ncbi:hypothetical protein BU15DRAFT_54131 [Melanogaster broomeanus]|nr:hypothetical protein BU15DRAFT_54131 [Melanogaster broomeanus]
MADEVIGTCCSVAATICCDLLAGICLDFTSIRHQFTEHLCSCSCRRRRKPIQLDDPADEQEPFIPETQQPSSQPPMRSGS